MRPAGDAERIGLSVQISNEANCMNISNGTYLIGPCPTDEFEFAEVEETFCGPTAGFLRIESPDAAL